MATIPTTTLEAIDAYVERKTPPGSFVRAVLENDLKESIKTADEFNLAALVDVVQHCIWNIPAIVWGSPEAVNSHLYGKGWDDDDEDD
jgi:hypothetical protein